MEQCKYRKKPEYSTLSEGFPLYFLIQIVWAICQLPFVLQRQSQSLLPSLLVLRCSWELRKSQVAKQAPREQNECVCSALESWGEQWPSGTSTLRVRLFLSGLERNVPAPALFIRLGKYRRLPKILKSPEQKMSNAEQHFKWLCLSLLDKMLSGNFYPGPNQFIRATDMGFLSYPVAKMPFWTVGNQSTM